MPKNLSATIKKGNIFSIVQTQGVFSDTSTTYNESGLTYNESGETYGGADRVTDIGPRMLEARLE